jgi:hypothetical protein
MLRVDTTNPNYRLVLETSLRLSEGWLIHFLEDRSSMANWWNQDQKDIRFGKSLSRARQMVPELTLAIVCRQRCTFNATT